MHGWFGWLALHFPPSVPESDIPDCCVDITSTRLPFSRRPPGGDVAQPCLVGRAPRPRRSSPPRRGPQGGPSSGGSCAVPTKQWSLVGLSRGTVPRNAPWDGVPRFLGSVTGAAAAHGALAEPRPREPVWCSVYSRTASCECPSVTNQFSLAAIMSIFSVHDARHWGSLIPHGSDYAPPLPGIPFLPRGRPTERALPTGAGRAALPRRCSLSRHPRVVQSPGR